MEALSGESPSSSVSHAPRVAAVLGEQFLSDEPGGFLRHGHRTGRWQASPPRKKFFSETLTQKETTNKELNFKTEHRSNHLEMFVFLKATFQLLSNLLNTTCTLKALLS
jgi:hypothetical protein